MQVRTFRASTIQEALAQVRRELGPTAAVLHTREVPAGGWLRRLSGRRQIEVTASTAVHVPSRVHPDAPTGPAGTYADPAAATPQAPGAPSHTAAHAHADTHAHSTAQAHSTTHATSAAYTDSIAHADSAAYTQPSLAPGAVQTGMPSASAAHAVMAQQHTAWPQTGTAQAPAPSTGAPQPVNPQAEAALRDHGRDELKQQLEALQDMVESLVRRYPHRGDKDLPDEWFRLYTDLIEVDIPEEIARGWIDRLRDESGTKATDDPLLLKTRVASILESEIQAVGPIQLTADRRRVVALVGPTGVGKTTTIAKLAANFRLRAKRNVGLITVDTYRIAAVEQLRTYADIIDLPMQVVSTPREMRQAVEHFAGLDLVLIDTAGRSPRDEVKIQELRALLAEAHADEVHLVLSSVAGATALEQTARRFATVGTTALLLTKLDEATSLGNILPVMRNSQLPLSYLTNGQNVPDDIESAEPARLAREILGLGDASPTPAA